MVPEERFCPQVNDKALADSLRSFAEATLQAVQLRMTHK
jgi:hypothetical protein